MASDVEPKVQTEGIDAEQTRGGQYYRPNVDIIETPDELLVVADMPGLASDLIDIRFEEGALTIHGRVPPRQPAGTRFLLQEYGLGDFFRTFRVSENIDSERITADYADGVLTLHLPKSERAKPRKIAVQAR
jgi:HSP20 family molecular chaperone IbpA